MNENAILTPRHTEVCELLVQGYALKEVAAELDITEKTADNHVQEIKKRFGVSKVGEVIVLFIKRKFNLSMDLTMMERRNRAIGFILIIFLAEVLTFSDFRIPTRRAKRQRTEIRCKLKTRDHV